MLCNLTSEQPDKCWDLICVYLSVCVCMRTKDWVKILERYLVKAGNVFRSITLTERAHCSLNTCLSWTCVSHESSVLENWSIIQYEVIWFGVYTCVCMSVCTVCIYVCMYICMCVCMLWMIRIYCTEPDGMSCTHSAAMRPPVVTCIHMCVCVFLVLTFNCSVLFLRLNLLRPFI